MLKNRTIGQIKADIDRCKQQIAKSMASHSVTNSEDAVITTQGFQIQLQKLEDELWQETRNIELINPMLLNGSGDEILFI